MNASRLEQWAQQSGRERGVWGEKREHIRAAGELSWGTHLPWGQANSQPPLSNYYRVLKTQTVILCPLPLFSNF